MLERTNSEGKVLLKSLVRLQGEDLRLLYTLFNEVTVWTALRNRVFDKINFISKTEDENHHFETLQEKAGDFVVEPDEELQLRLLLEIAKTLKIKKVHCANEADLIELTEHITDAVIQLLQEQDLDFTGSTIEKLAQWQLQKLAQSCQDCTSEGLDDTAQAEPKALPASSELLESTLTSEASTATAMATEVAVTAIDNSFAQNTENAQLEKELTEIKSALARIAKPSFLLKLFGGSTSWLSFSQSNLFREKLLPLLITLIILPELKKPSEESNVHLITLRWNQLHSDYQKLSETMQSIKKSQKQLEEQVDLTKAALTNLQEKLALNEKKETITRASLLEKVKDSQMFVRDGAVKDSDLYKGTKEDEQVNLLALQYLYKLGEVVLAEEKANNEPPKLLKKIKNWHAGQGQKKELTALEEQLIPALLNSTVTFANEERTIIHECQSKQQNLREKMEQNLAKTESLLQSIRVDMKHQEKLERELKELELNYYGLAGLA
ncbi:hypothetical protein F9B85_05750 [Heliorestis acidaminivorans]|uniref:Uncharacterized protein n=1 Tax=Heliorestis acidaminivorans TaxID=553427 RepID=A0A6I0F4B2_9FIRM|nr:hypothetical protein [Heliorestis acidaminivorans]KAB2953412.1 hypothetical protein F9B85_05750 [Heliorestis acidaminivorans]